MLNGKKTLVTLKIRSHGPKSNQFLRHPQGVFPQCFIRTDPGILDQLSTDRQTDGRTVRWMDSMKAMSPLEGGGVDIISVANWLLKNVAGNQKFQ